VAYEIIPQIGYGPIVFGMSSAEVRAILGQPSKVQEGIGKNETDHDEIKYNGKYTFEWYDENYPDGKHPQLSYYENRVFWKLWLRTKISITMMRKGIFFQSLD